MKVLVVSDNHRDEVVLEDLLSIYEEIDLWLHCGDSELPNNHQVWDTFQTVQGNMDWASYPEVIVESASDTIFTVLHGHKHSVKSTLKEMEDVALANQSGVVFYGHSHIPKVDKKENIFFINPGSISQPRGNYTVGSYAIYEEAGNEKFIRYYDWNHNEITTLSQKLV